MGAKGRVGVLRVKVYGVNSKGERIPGLVKVIDPVASIGVYNAMIGVSDDVAGFAVEILDRGIRDRRPADEKAAMAQPSIPETNGSAAASAAPAPALAKVAEKPAVDQKRK